MKACFRVLIFRDDETYSTERIRELIAEAERLGHPLEAGSYLEQLSIRQLDELVHGRTDA
jgi:hypothetical protein